MEFRITNKGRLFTHKKHSVPDLQVDMRKSNALATTFFRGLLLKSPSPCKKGNERDIDFQEAIALYFNSAFKQFVAQSTVETPAMPLQCHGQFCDMPSMKIPEELSKLRMVFYVSKSIINLGKNVFFSPSNDVTLKVIHPRLMHSVDVLIKKQMEFEGKIKKLVKALITQVSPSNLKKINQSNHEVSPSSPSSKVDKKDSGVMVPICHTCLIIYTNIYCRTTHLL